MAESRTKPDTCSPHGWTLDTLELYLSEKITAVEKAASAALASAEKAITKAESAAEKRADASNEIRAAMVDQQKNFADKSQTSLLFSLIEKRMDAVEKTLSMTGGIGRGVGLSATTLAQIISTAAIVLTAIYLVVGHH